MGKDAKKLSVVQIIILAFFLLVITGSLILKLPICSADGKSVQYIDALFTATTSVCVTGLVTLPTATAWSPFGQAVILFLIQVGGLGVITVITASLVLFQRRIGINNRMIISESFNLNSLGGIIRFVKKVILVTFVIEAIGALFYMIVFIPRFGLRGIWISIFTAVSAFCNAGIDIIGENSLCDYALNPIVNYTTMMLIISGGIGFVVMFDVCKIMFNKKRRGIRHLSLHSKIVLSVTSFLIIFGTVLIFIFEFNNPDTIGNYSLWDKLMSSLFQSVTLRTAGFATIDQISLTDASAFVSTLLMFIGGSPSGTAGGIKTVTFFVLIISTICVVRNKRTVDVFNRQISNDAIKRAITVFTVSFLTVICSTAMLMAFDNGHFIDVIYETVSATATVGLSRDYTSTLSFAGKIVVIFAMFLGRVGPVSLAFAFSASRIDENLIENPVEEISIG